MAGESRQHDAYSAAKEIQIIVDLTARIDERVQLMIQQQRDFEKKIDNYLSAYHELSTRVRMLESDKDMDYIKIEVERLKEIVHEIKPKIQSLQSTTEGQEFRWKSIFGFGLQLVWVILAAWLLYKLGIQAPAVP